MEAYFQESKAPNDLGRSQHWSTFYAEKKATSEASPFAHFVSAQLPNNSKLIEVGCGNGRDALFFSRNGHQVIGIDRSETAIEVCKKSSDGDSIVKFECGTLPDFVSEELGCVDADAIYSRFTIHAMPLVEEKALLSAASKILKPGGRLFLECRSINDSMARIGKAISPTERIHGHYRRFIILDELRERVEAAGFQILSEVESKGLAVFGNEDPTIIRVVAKTLTGL